jgi:hypothetical protein
MEHRCADYGRRGHQRQGLSSGHLIVRNRFTAVTMADGQIAVCFGSLNFANRTTSGRNRNESGACICPRTWPPKLLAARRTRDRDQHDRRETRPVSVRMLHEGGDAAARFEWINCGVSNPCSQSQYHKNDRPLEPNGWGSHDDSFVTWASLKTPICCRVLCGSHAATAFGNFNANVPEYASLTIKALALGKKGGPSCFRLDGAGARNRTLSCETARRP